MMKEKLRLKNEDGAVLVIALIILVLLTLMGIAITTTSEFEIHIAGNERIYKENVYNAEAAAMEAAQIMEEAASLDSGAISWIKSIGSVTLANIRDNAWFEANSQAVSFDASGSVRYLAVEEGVPEGTSLDMTKTGLYSYAIYGWRHNSANPNQGRSIVKVGYRRVF